eukprot:Em0001g2355a
MGKLSTIAIVWLRCMQPTKLGLLLGHLTTTTAITTLVYLQAMIGNGVLLNCTTAYGRSASLFKEVNDGTPHKLPATTHIPHECKDEDTCVFIFALRNLTELDGHWKQHMFLLKSYLPPECDNEQERGRETMITRVCSSPLRDRRKVLGNVDPQKRPRLFASPTPPPPPPTYSHLQTDGTPDEDGYYSFTVSVPGKPERMSATASSLPIAWNTVASLDSVSSTSPVRLCILDLTQRLPDLGSMVLVRLCILDFTQSLPDLLALEVAVLFPLVPLVYSVPGFGTFSL